MAPGSAEVCLVAQEWVQNQVNPVVHYNRTAVLSASHRLLLDIANRRKRIFLSIVRMDVQRKVYFS